MDLAAARRLRAGARRAGAAARRGRPQPVGRGPRPEAHGPVRPARGPRGGHHHRPGRAAAHRGRAGRDRPGPARRQPGRARGQLGGHAGPPRRLGAARRLRRQPAAVPRRHRLLLAGARGRLPRCGWSPTRWCTTASCRPGRSAGRRPPAAIRACSTGAARCTCSRSTCRSGPCSGRWPAAWPGPWSARSGACSPSSSARPPPTSARWPGCCGIRCCCGASAAAGPPTASTATRCCAASCRAPGRWAGSPSRRWACCPAGRATTAAGCTTPWWTSQATTCRCPRPTRPPAAYSPARASCSSSAWPWSRWSRSGR